MKSNLNAKDIIIIRKNLDTKINKNWKIIKAENMISKAAKKAGMYSGYDLNMLYNQIIQWTAHRIMIKGILQTLNNGGKTFDFEEFKKTNNYSIFAANEAKEAIARWKAIPCLNPETKAQKGKKRMSKTETFTSAKIDAIISKLQLEANKHDAALAKFNDSTTIEVDADEDFNANLAG